MAINDQIVELLQFAVRPYNVTLQVHQAKEQLNIVINRPSNVDVDYSTVADTLLEKLYTLQIDDVEKFKFMGRVEKQTQPEWQQMVNNQNAKKSGFMGGLFGKKK
ncbi:hypothetical protein BST81_05120 [Leptolyngbya sp. 'hensonii']|uniref:hypothetical protein n=1 Tax=Leptolyngbya sp. 'hensonii' TaxID=1922337 RepID=UPI00094FD44F|nr:hypothetical protein [Leptolyngbya sp. 'hensonii']OLP19508.1 hypothetical protein BST81_05120 [Leptolyngbya sp. 'hensonii']